jgi:hypothetical protein
MAWFALGVADFRIVHDDVIADHVLSSEVKIEAKGKTFTDADAWLKAAKSRNHIYGLCCGYEHTETMNGAAVELHRLHDENPRLLPFVDMMNAFEELAARYEEELEESLYRILAILKTDKPNKEKVRAVATTELPLAMGGGCSSNPPPCGSWSHRRATT